MLPSLPTNAPAKPRLFSRPPHPQSTFNPSNPSNPDQPPIPHGLPQLIQRLFAPLVFHRWLLKRFLKLLTAVLILILSLIFLFHFAETIRNVDFLPAVTTSFFISCNNLTNFLSFIFILTTVLFFASLHDRSELIAAQVLSFSPWQIILAPVMAALSFGVVYVFLFSPILAVMNQQLKSKNTATNNNPAVDIIGDELWLRESISTSDLIASAKNDNLQLTNGQNITPTNFNGVVIIHGNSIVGQDKKLKNVEMYFIRNDSTLRAIFLASEAQLEDNQWQLRNLIRYQQGAAVAHLNNAILPSALTRQTIKNLLLAPADLSIYKLHAYLNQVEKLGFSVYPYKNYFHFLITLPFTLAAMTLLAAGFGKQPRGRGRRLRVLIVAVVFGFFIHFLLELMKAFLISQGLASWLTAWLPTMVIWLLSLSLFLHREES